MRIVGKDLVTKSGALFQIFGVNVCGFEIPAHGFCIGGIWGGKTLDEIASNIRAGGMNTVRIPFHPRVFENNPVPDNILGVWTNSPNEKLKGKGSLDMFNLFIEALEKQGLYYIIDHHFLYDVEDLNKRIPPFWYADGYTEAQWLGDLARIAALLKGKPGFIGIDLKNEPGQGCTWGSGDSITDWKMAVEKAYFRIDKEDQECLIIVEPYDFKMINDMDSNPPGIPASRLLFSPHIYGPDGWQWMVGLNDPSFPENQRGSLDTMIGKVAKTRAVYLGEFGGNYGSGPTGQKEVKHFDFFISYLKENGILNATHWAYGPNGGWATNGLTDETYIKYKDDKLNAFKRLKTDRATLSTDNPKPTPIDPKPVDPTPKPSTSFKKGEILKHRSFGGPAILYVGDGKGEFFTDEGLLGRLDVDEERFMKV